MYKNMWLAFDCFLKSERIFFSFALLIEPESAYHRGRGFYREEEERIMDARGPLIFFRRTEGYGKVTEVKYYSI